jgi:hypothetical protein
VGLGVCWLGGGCALGSFGEGNGVVLEECFGVGLGEGLEVGLGVCMRVCSEVECC